MDNLESMEYLNQTRYFVGAGQYDDALEYINKAIAVDKMNKELYVQKCIVLANMDRFDDAIVEAKNALKLDKSFGEAYFHLGSIYLMTGDQASGLENYNKAIANGFDDAQIFFNLGLMYEEEDNDELALRNYSKAILKDPLRVDARVRKAKLYIANGKHPEALKTLDELILADPDLYDGYHLKALLLAEMGKTDESLKVLDEAAQLFPKDPAFLLDRVNIYVMREEPEQAKQQIALLEGGYDMSLEQKRHLELEKARLHALDTDFDAIVESLLKAREYMKQMDPDSVDPEATFLLVNCYLQKEDYDSAKIYSQELIRAEDLSYAMPAYYMLPLSYDRKGEREEAMKLYKESVSKLRAITLENPELLDGYFFRALCLKEMGEYDKANDLCDYLLKIDGNNASFHGLKGEILRASGREEEAAAEKALAQSLQK